MDRDEKEKAYYTLFRDTDFGVMVLNDLLDKFYKPTFVTPMIDSVSLALNAGGREVIVYILSQIEEYENRGRG